jgi:hypothetical protein
MTTSLRFYDVKGTILDLIVWQSRSIESRYKWVCLSTTWLPIAPERLSIKDPVGVALNLNNMLSFFVVGIQNWFLGKKVSAIDVDNRSIGRMIGIKITESRAKYFKNCAIELVLVGLRGIKIQQISISKRDGDLDGTRIIIPVEKVFFIAEFVSVLCPGTNISQLTKNATECSLNDLKWTCRFPERVQLICLSIRS